MQWIKKVVVDGDAKIEAEIPEFESLKEAVDTVGGAQTLYIANKGGGFDINGRSFVRSYFRATQIAPARDEMLDHYRSAGTGRQRVSDGLEPGDSTKFERYLGRLVKIGQLEAAAKLGKAFEKDAKGTIEALYAKGKIHKRVKKEDTPQGAEPKA